MKPALLQSNESSVPFPRDVKDLPVRPCSEELNSPPWQASALSQLEQSIIDEIRHLQAVQMTRLETLIQQPVNELKTQQARLILEFQQLRSQVGDQDDSRAKKGSQQRLGMEAISPAEVLISTTERNPGTQDTGKQALDDDDGDDPDDEELMTSHTASMDFVELKEGGSLGSVFSSDCDVDAPVHNVADYYWKTGLMREIAIAQWFANVSVFVVVLNAIYIGVESDYNNAQNVYEANAVFQACSQFFCVFFTWELLVRFLALEHKRDCLRDGWFTFDSFLVSTMILDTWVLMPALMIVGGGVTIPTQPLRMLRLFKLTRMARLMKAFPELVTMIKGLIRSLRAVSSSMILIGLLVYVWAIMLHMLMKEEYDFNDTLWRESMLGFSTMTQCIWTLLIDGTLMLDDTGPLMTMLLFSSKPNYIMAGIGVVTYSVLSAMLILQSLIGVLCDVVSTVGQEERDSRAIGLVKQEIMAHLKEFDAGDGSISQKELKSVVTRRGTKVLMKQLQINSAFFWELQKGLFTKPGQRIPIRAALDLMIMCQGYQPTTVEAMAGGILSVIHELCEVKKTFKGEVANLSVLHREFDAKFEGLRQLASQTPPGRCRSDTLQASDTVACVNEKATASFPL